MSYHIRLSNNKKIVDAIKQSGINTEYKPRFEVLIDGKIIGGSTYDLVSNTYLFDIGILEEYQGMGIAKDLMKKIIQDAKELGVEKISTYVVNERFSQYLNSIGFSVYDEEATIYISTMQQYKTIASFNGNVKIYDGKLGYANLLKLTHEMPKNIEHIEVLHKDDDFGDFYSWSNKIVENNFGSNFKEGFPIVNFLKDGSEVEVITAYGELENGVSILFDKDNLEWVVEFAEGGLLAPNGKKSNLTPEQYKLVRTPQFKSWFGDWQNDPSNASKVVDSNGEPLVCYHGTYVKEQFDDKADLGFHFGTYEQAKERSQTKMYLQGYKSIINSYFLNIRELVNVHDVGEWEYPQRYIDTLISEGLITEKEAKQNGFYDIYYRDDNKLVREFLINKFGNIGFDYENKIESKGLSYLVLQPNQIKLADGTNTTFDMNNPNIRFAKGGEIAEHEETYKKWKSLVNMTKSELENFYNSKEGKEAGLSSSEAKGLGIHSGRESARWVMKMKDTPHKDWTPKMWEWAKRQISFISRMSGNKGGLYDDKGNKKRKHTSLLIWGHNPKKYESGGTISQTPASKEDKVYGSKVNAKGSSKDTKSAKEIKFDAKTLLSINDKVREHNKQHPNKKITLASAKAVVRRGMGAYSSTHRPTISGGKPNSRVAWGLARLNAFMYKIIHAKSKSGKYSQDDDLINELGYKVKSYDDGGSVPKSMQPLLKEIDKYKTAKEFNDAHTQEDLMDLSNPKQHRFGRIFTDYGEGIQDVVAINKAYRKDLDLEKKANVPRVIDPLQNVTIYRMAHKEASGIEVGDYVSFSKDYVSSHRDGLTFKGKLLKMEVPAKDVIWQGNDFNEWVYSPKEIRDKYSDLQDFYNKQKSKSDANKTFDAENNDIRYEQGGIFNDKELLAKWEKGESIGFTAIAHLKAKGLIPRADGTKRKSEKYMDNGGLIEKLRAEEQEEYHNMSNPKDEIKRKEIYDKYDKLITPLMENGGSIQKLIQLPDVQSSEDTLKRVLDMQGYTLDKKSMNGGLFKPHKSIEQIAKEKNVPLQYANKQLQKGIEVESEHSDSLNVQKTIALQHLDEMIDYYDKLEIMEKKYKDGGVVVGKRHSESDENGSGEKFLVKSTGQVVELEGGEGVLSAKSMQSDKMYTFDGKRMNGREVASYLNHKYGGVEFAKGGEVGHVCGCKQYYHGGELPTATVDELEGGEAVITVKTMESKNKYNFNGSNLTPRQILSQINSQSGGKKFEEGGILDLKKYKLEMTHKLAKMVYFAENLLHLK